MKHIYVPIALTTNVYVTTLLFQVLFIVVDIGINEATQWTKIRSVNIYLVITFCIQDVVLIFAAMLLGHTMFRTHVFKAGFVRILLHRFKFAITFTLLYLGLTILYQVITLIHRWKTPLEHVWPTGYSVLFVAHRLMAILYYYYYKRAAMRLSDARYYDEEWVKHSFAH